MSALQYKNLGGSELIDLVTVQTYGNNTKALVCKNTSGTELFKVDSVNNAVTINADLNISGTTSQNLVITDKLVHVAKDNATDSYDAGLFVEYKPSSTVLYSAILRKAGGGWRLYKDYSSSPNSNWSGPTYDDLNLAILYATSKVLNATGSVSAPAYAFTSYTDTGLYMSGANTLDVSVAGTNRLSINTSAITANLPLEIVTIQNNLSYNVAYMSGITYNRTSAYGSNTLQTDIGHQFTQTTTGTTSLNQYVMKINAPAGTISTSWTDRIGLYIAAVSGGTGLNYSLYSAGKVYIGGQLDIAANTLPSASSTYDLGSSSYKFSNAYIDSVYLQTTGGTPSALNYYESGSFSLTTSGAYVTTWTVYYTRIGKQITMTFPNDSSSRTVSASRLIVTAGQIPARLRPNNTLFGFIYSSDNNSGKQQSWAINNGGGIDIGNSTVDVTAAYTAGTVVAGPYSWTATFAIS